MPFEFIGNIKRNYLNKKSKIPQKNLIIVQFWWELCLQWAVLAGGPLLHLYCYLWFVARNPGKRQKPQSTWDLNWKIPLGKSLHISLSERKFFTSFCIRHWNYFSGKPLFICNKISSGLLPQGSPWKSPSSLFLTPFLQPLCSNTFSTPLLPHPATGFLIDSLAYLCISSK